jgi:aspartyl-tRNA(Asn)/glutamyl-tRNA(Gln) amidotransferase subunit A
MTHDELAFSDATTLGKMIAAKKISSLELTNIYLDRLARYGAKFGAVVTIMPERARAEAMAADRALVQGQRASALHGVPYGVKDLLAATGAPTTWGAAPYRNQMFDYDATVVARLRAAGAVLLAKLSMVELAGGFGYDQADASLTGPGRTPWNRDYWSGGSSSGPGAAVAAGLVGFAIGSETNGSIVNPSTFCGVSGLRPTFGRVSRHGAMALMWTSDKLGPMARSARDAGLILRTIAGADPHDASAKSVPFRAASRRPRIGIIAKSMDKSQPSVVANFKRSLDVLRDFADVTEDVPHPDFPYTEVFTALLQGECASAFRDLIESGRSKMLRSPDDKIGGYEQYATLAVDFVDAMRQRAKIDRAVRAMIAPYDALVHPSQSTIAYPVGPKFSKTYTQWPGAVDPVSSANLAGIPAMSIPNGFAEHGLPTGLGIVANAWREPQLVAIGLAYQSRTTFHKRRPTL